MPYQSSAITNRIPTRTESAAPGLGSLLLLALAGLAASLLYAHARKRATAPATARAATPFKRIDRNIIHLPAVERADSGLRLH